MLDFIRQNAGSWLIKFILGAIVVVFIFWGVGNYRSQRMQVVARVNGEEILIPQYQRAYSEALDRYSKVFGQNLTPELIKRMGLKQLVLDGLIQQALIRQEAERLGIRVTDRELQEVILGVPAFQNNGAFDKRLYERMLRRERMTISEFENKLRDDILNSKVNLLLTSSVSVTDAEAKDYYRYKNQEIQISYAVLPPDTCRADVKASDEELKSWFEANKERYRTQPQIAISYILIPRKKIEKKIQLSEAELKEYYEQHKEEFHLPEERRARHILVKVGPDAKENEAEAARQKAEEILQEIKKGGDFAELAKKYSDDTATKTKGGDLGFFRRGVMVKPFDEAVFSMKKGEVKGPVRTTFGWHLIKLEEVRPEHTKSFEEARSSIAKKILGQKVNVELWNEANKVYDAIIESGSMEANAKASGMALESTPLFDKDNVPELLSGAPSAVDNLFSLNTGELSSLLEVPQGILIAQIKEKKEPYIPKFDTVKEKVKAAYVKEKAVELCGKRAAKVLEAARKDGLAKAANKLGIEVRKSGFFKRISGLGAAQLPTDVAEAAKFLRESKPLPDAPIHAGEKWYVIEYAASRPADMAAFSKEKEEIMKSLLQLKRNMILEDWIHELRQKAKIEQVTKL